MGVSGAVEEGSGKGWEFLYWDSGYGSGLVGGEAMKGRAKREISNFHFPKQNLKLSINRVITDIDVVEVDSSNAIGKIFISP